MKNKILKYLSRFVVLFIIMLCALLVVVTQPVFSSSTDKETLASVDKLKAHVKMLSETILNDYSIEDNLNQKAAFIVSEVQQYTPNFSEQIYDVDGTPYKNIVVTFDGKDKDCKTTVIGAHYDTYDYLPGADDNSSGTAGLLELVRLFSNKPPQCDLQLVFYTLEEPPYFRTEFMGSYIHAKSLSDNNVEVEQMFSLEMIGYFSDEDDSQAYPVKGMKYLYSDKGNFITLVGDLSQMGITRVLKSSMRNNGELPVYSINAPASIPGIDFSDHLNYWHFGYPALMITDTAFNRNENYHTEEDTIEKLDFKRMAQVVDAVFYSIK